MRAAALRAAFLAFLGLTACSKMTMLRTQELRKVQEQILAGRREVAEAILFDQSRTPASVKTDFGGLGRPE